MANVTFIFGTSPNAKPEEKKVWGHGILYTPQLQKRGGHVSRVSHQIAPMIWREKLFTQNVTNVIFGFETSTNTNPKRKKWVGHGILCPPRQKSGGRRPPCPPPNCAHDDKNLDLKTIYLSYLHYILQYIVWIVFEFKKLKSLYLEKIQSNSLRPTAKTTICKCYIKPVA